MVKKFKKVLTDRLDELEVEREIFTNSASMIPNPVLYVKLLLLERKIEEIERLIDIYSTGE